MGLNHDDPVIRAAKNPLSDRQSGFRIFVLTLALAELVKRPQAELQIGAVDAEHTRDGDAVKPAIARDRYRLSIPGPS